MEAQIRTRPDNDEATEAWNGPLFDRWLAFREILVVGVTAHGEAAMRANPPSVGDRVIDIGCGLGDTTGRLSELVGPEGSTHGIDVAERMIETARSEQTGANVSFEVGDVQYDPINQRYDYAFSRLGTMFFANPVAALRNVRSALEPGASLNMVVWRQKPDNEWLYRAELVAKEYLDEPEPEETDEPTCGPGPFAMAGADVTSGILVSSGFEEITLRRSDLPITIGRDMHQAIDVSLAIGPAGEVLRLWGERAEEVRPEIEGKLREAFADFVRDDGSLVSPSSTWLVSAVNPG
ncbi:methyltransferase domain-containing protein [soil metagenome]